MKIGFIGTGIMGSSMIKNLLKNGHSVNCYNRTTSKAKALEEFGAKAYETVSECVNDVDAVITIVGYPKDVEETYNVIIPNVSKDTVLIDMTTSSPSLAKDIYNKAKENGLSVLDAPVSGGDIGAKNGTLTIMVGGDEDTFNKVLPIFEALGTTITYIGKAGSGQHTKMANQIAITGTIAADMEAMIYSLKMGLDQETVFRAISKGSAQSNQLDINTWKAIHNDFAPGFFIKHFVKDMRIAKKECENIGLELPIMERVLKSYEELVDKGCESLGTQALYKYYLEA